MWPLWATYAIFVWGMPLPRASGAKYWRKQSGEKSAPGGYDRHPVPGAVNLGKIVGAEEKVMRPAQREMKEYGDETGERSYDDGREVEDAVV